MNTCGECGAVLSSMSEEDACASGNHPPHAKADCQNKGKQVAVMGFPDVKMCPYCVVDKAELKADVKKAMQGLNREQKRAWLSRAEKFLRQKEKKRK